MEIRKKPVRYIYYYCIALVVCLLVEFGFNYFLGWEAHYYQAFILALVFVFLMIGLKKTSPKP